MAVEEKLRSKYLYKVLLYLLKVIPMVMAFTYLLNTVLSYFDIDLEVLSYLSSTSLLSMTFFYIASYVFRFCAYYRMFIYYIGVNWLIDIIDIYVGIPLDDMQILKVYLILSGISLFIILYLYVRNNKKTATKNSR